MTLLLVELLTITWVPCILRHAVQFLNMDRDSIKSERTLNRLYFFYIHSIHIHIPWSISKKNFFQNSYNLVSSFSQSELTKKKCCMCACIYIYIYKFVCIFFYIQCENTCVISCPHQSPTRGNKTVAVANAISPSLAPPAALATELTIFCVMYSVVYIMSFNFVNGVTLVK